jgi:outer membrane receptor protein involved in Fe transport
LTPATFPSRPPFVLGERVRGFEGGVKAKMFDDQLALTATGYTYNYTNLQVAFYFASTNTAAIQNGANAKVQGAELGGDYTPNALRGLTLSAFLNYNDTYYTKFLSAPCYLGQSPTTCVGGAQNLSGKTVYFAPKWAGKLGAAYKWDLNQKYAMSLDSELQFSSSYYGSPDLNPYSLQKSYWLLNAALHLTKSDSAWDIALMCRNCTNKLYIVAGQDDGTPTTPAVDVVVGRPQQILLELTLHPDLL